MSIGTVSGPIPYEIGVSLKVAVPLDMLLVAMYKIYSFTREQHLFVVTNPGASVPCGFPRFVILSNIVPSCKINSIFLLSNVSKVIVSLFLIGDPPTFIGVSVFNIMSAFITLNFMFIISS